MRNRACTRVVVTVAPTAAGTMRQVGNNEEHPGPKARPPHGN